MNTEFGSDTLLIIPCRASKSSGGLPLGETVDPLKDMVPESAYASMLTGDIAKKNTNATP
jgi:hypothetical protein